MSQVRIPMLFIDSEHRVETIRLSMIRSIFSFNWFTVYNVDISQFDAIFTLVLDILTRYVCFYTISNR